MLKLNKRITMEKIVLIIPVFLSYLLIKFIFRVFRLKYYKLFNKNKYFLYSLKLAHQGFFKYEGLTGSYGYCNLPQGIVHYPDGSFSISMPIGNALDYSKIFGGEIIQTN